MEREQRSIIYDKDLLLEAYHFYGLKQKFPSHFHDHYVIGLIDRGERRLEVNSKEHLVGPDTLLLFNPRDSHACTQSGGRALAYRGLNIKASVLKKIAEDISGRSLEPRFIEPTVFDVELAAMMREFHCLVMSRGSTLQKEEKFFFLVRHLLNEHAVISGETGGQVQYEAIEAACRHLETNFNLKISLNDLAGLVGLNKYTLLRGFTRHKGITPYRYLETIRISKAKNFLEQGISPAETALATGFVDQSHFTTFFKELIGLTPKQYQSIFDESLPVKQYEQP